jgi:hypothetical protein
VLSSAGESDYSGAVEVKTGPSNPGQCSPPYFVSENSDGFVLRWKPGVDNGAPITEYTLQMALLPPIVLPQFLLENLNECRAVPADVLQQLLKPQPAKSLSNALDSKYGQNSLVSEINDALRQEDLKASGSDLLLPGLSLTSGLSSSKSQQSPLDKMQFEAVYQGPAAECSITNDRLVPATVHCFRVQASNKHGPGLFGDLCAGWKMFSCNVAM